MRCGGDGLATATAMPYGSGWLLSIGRAAATPPSLLLSVRRVVLLALHRVYHVFPIIISCRRPTDADERFRHDCLRPLDVGSVPDRYLLVVWR